MLKNNTLKTKMSLGFALAILVMFSAALYGLMGLIENNDQFTKLTVISNESHIAAEIDSFFYQQRLTLKKYEATSSQEYIDQFERTASEIDSSLEILKDISKSDERIKYISDIQIKKDEYINKFDLYKGTNVKIMPLYDEISNNGNEIINALRIIKEISFENSEYDIYNSASDSLESLLKSRLYALKFFDFHTQAYYDDYLESFTNYVDSLSKLEGIERNSLYKAHYYSLMDNSKAYGEKMSVLKDHIDNLDVIMLRIDSLGPEMSELTYLINESTAQELSKLHEQIIEKNNLRSGVMLVLSLISVILGVFVAIKILKMVLNPINYLTDTFKHISESSETNVDFRLEDDAKDEIGMMSSAFNNFMIKIQNLMEDISYQSKIKTFESDIASISRDEGDLDAASNKILDYICDNLDILIGALYLPDKDEYILTSTHAYTMRTEGSTSVRGSEGLIGQSIKEKKMIVVDNLSNNHIPVQSGLGSSNARSILILPCIFENNIECLLELASVDNFREDQIRILDEISQIIARFISSLRLQNQMKELYSKTMEQSEELQMQQEELRQSNEELEEQTKSLLESESKLQMQQEELRVSNEELQTYTKQLEDQKQELNKRNEDLLKTQEEMKQKANELAKANKYKSEFLANMSHELRTPLNSILVLSQLLEDRNSNEPLSDKEREFASTIYTSGSDLLNLINGVLDLSKVEAGKLQINNEKIYISELIQENEKMFSQMAQTKNIDLDFEIEEGISEYIVTDHMRINQIIKNLLSNAIKFTHEGHVKLKVRPLDDKEANATNRNKNENIVIEVSDTGIGIPKDKLEEVFEAFKQSDGTTSRQYGGTGLGLTISLELAKLLNAQILLESKVGHGSKFALVVPINMNTIDNTRTLSDIVKMNELSYLENTIKLEADNGPYEDMKVNNFLEDEMEGGSPSSKESNKTREEGKKLLIIEDDLTFAQILSDLAVDRGYEVLMAHSAKEGILMAKRELPTGIILDIGLPDMDGYMLAELLSKDEDTKNIPIHIISGNDSNIEKTFPKSIIGFLKKPVDIKSIYKTLAKIESINSKNIKNILAVGKCGDEDFSKFSKLGQVSIEKVTSAKEAIELLKEKEYACIVLDIKLEDMNGIDFMSKIRIEHNIETPIVIYTEEEIDADELDDINRYAETIILKSSRSKDRLVDEVSLFLHDVDKNINSDTIKIASEEKKGLEGVRVLLADDDNRNIFALIHVLEKYGMKIVVAKDGVEAVNQFKNNEIDIVLMDIMMPKMDGYEAISSIRSLDIGKNVPIIALTAKAMMDDKDKCISAGANDYLTKPVDVERLLSMIKVWLS